jgi:dTDP-4-dehydrorhamnose reductase
MIGFESIKSKLFDAYQSQKLHHAILLLGKKGVGKASFALEFAQEISKSLAVDINLVKPTDSKSFVRPAVRPKYSVLSNKKWKEAGLTPLRSWKEAWAKAAQSVLSNI